MPVQNIIGEWVGFYEQSGRRVIFTAIIHQAKQSNNFYGSTSETLYNKNHDGIIDGSINLSQITFTKRYTALHQFHIKYIGTYLQENVIRGKWYMDNDDGMFEMKKKTETDALINNEEFEEIIKVKRKENALKQLLKTTKN